MIGLLFCKRNHYRLKQERPNENNQKDNRDVAEVLRGSHQRSKAMSKCSYRYRSLDGKDYCTEQSRSNLRCDYCKETGDE